MPRLRYSANTRPRVRLLSTPTREEPDMSTTFAGVKFSDQTAALIAEAVEAGFRVEADTRGKSPANKGVIIYPPDTNVSPITFNERGAKFNRAHTDNLRRELARAGLTSGDDAETKADNPAEPAPAVLTAPPKGGKPADGHEIHIRNFADVQTALGSDDLEVVASTVAALVRGPLNHAPSDSPLPLFSDLLGAIGYAVAIEADTIMKTVIGVVTERVRRDLATEVNEALGMASAAEAEAERLRKALAKAEASEAQARTDCGAALRRAEEAEGKARELEAAIAPLRAILATKD